MNMTTQLQTVEITLFGRKNRIHSLEEYPICPVQIPEYEEIMIDCPNGDTYIWDKDGSASILYLDGTYRFFRKKPTIADAVYNLCGYSDSCFQFFKDGSVEHRLDTRCYWWGPTITGTPVVKSYVYPPSDEDDEICEVCNTKGCYNLDCMHPDGCDTCQSKNCSGCSY